MLVDDSEGLLEPIINFDRRNGISFRYLKWLDREKGLSELELEKIELHYFTLSDEKNHIVNLEDIIK